MISPRLSPEKETVAFDVEGTLTTGTAWEGIRAYLEQEGQGDRYIAFRRRMTPRYLLYKLKLGDEQAFKERWIAGMLGLLAGRTREEIEALARQMVEQRFWPARREDVLADLYEHQSAGRQVALVSGQFQPFLDAFVAKSGADLGLGTPGVWQDGRFTGKLAAPFTTGETKVERLNQALSGSTLHAAYGDTGPDAAMLAMSEFPTAVYPDDALLSTARANGWRIVN
jgi:HAD superfamily phosphoserine phosphatase-like hydrolase